MTAIIEERVRHHDASFFGHPQGLGWISFTEVWERFSYYGMQTLLVLYMTHQILLPGHREHVLGFAPFRALLQYLYGPLSTQALGSVIFGLYAGLVWITPIFGGLLADRVLGRAITIIAGAVLMTTGHFLMAFDQSFLIALLCLLVGAGCFKGNLASQVDSLYAPGDPRTASGFQIYYFGIEIAVTVTPLVCGTLGEIYGWHWGFGAAGVGMVISLALYLRGRRWLPPEHPVRQSADLPRVAFTSDEWRKVLLLVALLPLLAVAQVTQNQGSNAYVIWAEKTLQLTLFGARVPVTWLQTLHGIGLGSSIVLSLVFWRWWSRRRVEPDEISKIATGGVLLMLAPLILVAASLGFAVSGHRASLTWAVIYELVVNLGWANVAPVSLALYARLAPTGASSTIIGVFYLQFFLSNMFAGWLGVFLEKMSAANFWLMHAALAGGAALILLLLRRPVARAFLEPEPAPTVAAA